MTHEFDGKKYEKASAHQKEWGAKLIAEFGMKGTERVLDLGCGDGTLTVQIAERLPQGEVVGIDASQGMIDAALPKTQQNLQFLLMDINELDFVERFDIVFSVFNDASYAERYNILCRKLVQEGLYSAASVILSPRTALETGEYTELSELTNLKTFVSVLAGHIAAEAARAS